MTTSIYSVSDTQSQILVDGTAAVTIDKVGGISSGVKAAAISGLSVTQANQTPLPAAGTVLSFTHGLESVPFSVEIELICLVAEFGYSIGDVVSGAMTGSSASYYTNFVIRRTATVVEAKCGGAAAPFAIVNYTTGGFSNPTSVSWAWRFKVRAV